VCDANFAQETNIRMP